MDRAFSGGCLAENLITSSPPGRSRALKGTPAAVIGHVEAPDAESAIAKAIEEFHITDPKQQKRLAARRVR
jgi:hypothetical protein